MPYPMTEVLISRTMTRTRIDGATGEVEIRFGTPTFSPPDEPDAEGDYFCPIQFVSFQDERIYAGVSVDALSALLEAFYLAPMLLKTSLIGEELDWKEAPNYGFPVRPMVARPAPAGEFERR